MKAVDPRTIAGRAFVRSLNILLKFARLYGFDHVRTKEQLGIAWHELSAAIPPGNDSGLLLGATGSQLLLDGVPLEGSPAEKQFAQLLSAAGLGSVQFFSSITEDELNRFARAFPTGKAKPAELALQLKSVLSNARGIRINEICFVATDSRMKEAGMAAQLAAVTLGDDSDQFKRWLNDPQKLLEMIAAAQGSKGAGTPGTGIGAGTGPAKSEQEHEVSLTLRRVGASLIARRQSMPVRRAPLPTHPLLRPQPWLVPDSDLGSAQAAASPSPAKRKCTASSRLSRILDKSAQEALEAQAPPTRFTKNFPTCPLALRTF